MLLAYIFLKSFLENKVRLMALKCDAIMPAMVIQANNADIRKSIAY